MNSVERTLDEIEEKYLLDWKMRKIESPLSIYRLCSKHNTTLDMKLKLNEQKSKYDDCVKRAFQSNKIK